MIDIVMERADQGLCPICKETIGTEFKVEIYNGKKIWICKGHPTPQTNKENPTLPLRGLNRGIGIMVGNHKDN